MLKVENISKKYVLDHQNHSSYMTFREAFSQFAKNIFFQSKIQGVSKSGSSRDDFWALDDISFEVKQGDRLGIIGSNGAGKSTLLKIISRITEPTKGRVSISGRVASLLEVGTGFHPELTGRENIFLNGAILGMRKREISKKFDEIVNFAEVEKFLDTPVKKYSSGMYVRLAFSVAAHLEPEILILDEVLAVGDLQFQKKCLGKMEGAAKDGKTIILVSHNMQTILSLSNRSLLLEGGKIKDFGDPYQVVSKFQSSFINSVFGQKNLDLIERYGDGRAKFKSIEIEAFDNDGVRVSSIIVGCNLEIRLTLEADEELNDVTVAVTFYDEYGLRLIDINNIIKGYSIDLVPGKLKKVIFLAKDLRLKPGIYVIGLWVGRLNECDIDGVRYSTSFRMESKRIDTLFTNAFPGIYSCDFNVSSQ